MKPSAALVLLFLALPSLALQRPRSQEELGELDSIRAAMDAERASFPRKRAALVEERENLRLKVDKASELAAKVAEIEVLDASHARTMNEIVRRTRALFGIEPPRSRGALVAGRLAGAQSSWDPRYAPKRVSRTTIGLDGRPLLLTTGANWEGITWSDGAVEVNDDAFISPGYLGAVLFHESIHFEQFITPGQGDVITAVQSELRAHSRSSGREASEVFQLTPGERSRIHKSHQNQLERFRKNPDVLMIAVQFESGGSPEQDRATAESEFDRSGKDAAPLSRLYQPAGPTARAAEPPPQPLLIAPRAREDTPNLTARRVPEEEVVALARAACRSDWAAAVPSLAYFSSLSPIALERLASRREEDSCVNSLLARLTSLHRSGGVLTLERLQAETSAVRTPPPDEFFIERETRSGKRPCVQRGIWHKDCY